MFKWIKKRFTPRDQMEVTRRLRITVQELSERVERMRREQTNREADAPNNV